MAMEVSMFYLFIPYNNDYTETVLFAKVYHKELHNKIDYI